MFRLGLIINPVAGIGGRVALKGSDGEAVQQLARERGAMALSRQRMRTALEPLLAFKDELQIFTASGSMGDTLCRQMGFNTRVVARISHELSTPEDTEQTVRQCVAQGVDLLVFAGGDGTARNVYHVLHELGLDETLPVIGVPAGCKIHSSVYALTPSHAGELLALLVKGRALTLAEASVMDIDEEAFRQDQVRAKRYGQLCVPAENQFMQSMKEGGVTHEELALQDIAAFIVETMLPDCLYLIGSGTTPKAVLDELGLESTLLGIDAVLNGQLLAADLSEQQILDLLDRYPQVRLVITLIGGQGHVFGRGNQQLSPQVIRRIGMAHIDIISTAEKIHSLNGQPLRVDTGDEALDKSLKGMVPVITGYDEKTLYRIA